MPKDQTIVGTRLQTVWWMTYAEAEEGPSLYSCRRLIDESLQNTLKECDSFPEVVTFTMRADPIRRTITVTSYVQKKTHEKNGQT
jgi:hypothetical protein